MKPLLDQLNSLVAGAMNRAFGAADTDPQVRASTDAKFGDYQCNAAMGLSKRLGAKPRDIAQKIVDALLPDASIMIEPPEIAGPGFINLRLKTEFLENLCRQANDDRLGIETCPAADAQTVVVDYSSPNVAKEMHVGHLRSTVIGDTITRVLAFQGHTVIRQNHLGDWGTQFGKIILSLWHLCMCRHQNETAPDFERLADEISRLANADIAVKLPVLDARRKFHQDNLDRDPDGREFQAFIQSFEPSFELLLPAYRYVNAVEGAAEGTDLRIENRSTGETYPLSAVSRHVAAMLQGKTAHDNTQELIAWRKARDATLRECNRLYRRLGVLLNDDDIRGESFYEPLLPGVVEEVRSALSQSTAPNAPTRNDAMRAVCREDRGAICVFLENPDGSPAFKGPAGDPLPMIIQKSDGASLYATTDIAAALFRVAHAGKQPIRLRAALQEQLTSLGGGLGADRVIYVVGAPQKLHFQMFFPTIRCLGWLDKQPGQVRLEHVAFGSVLGEDRKMLRTRSGDSVKLRDLLDEAVARAEKMVRDTESDPGKRRGFPEAEVTRIAEVVGIGAVKYADLCQNRNTDYVFSWDKMLALQGNTAPYLLYAYARIQSIYRKGAEAGIAAAPDEGIALVHPAERALALRILQFGETVDAVADNLLPNFLCDYLYDLAGRFMTFYEACSVLAADDKATQASRLALCRHTAQALKVGLDLLGIPVLERM